jgi:hypothetical protein
MDPGEMGYERVNEIELAWDMARCQAFINVAVNLRVP